MVTDVKERGADMAGFVGGKELSLFLAGFSLPLPCLHSPSPSLQTGLPLNGDPFVVKFHFLHGPYLFHPPTSASLLHGSHIHPPPLPCFRFDCLLNNASNFFIPCHFLLPLSLFSPLSIMCSSPLPRAQLLPPCLISDAVY